MRRLIRWWFWWFMLACLGICAWMLAGAEPQTKPVKPAEIDQLSAETFKVGIMLGYSCCQRGGSKDDVEYLIACFTNQRPDLVGAWMQNGKQ